jgi:aspartyl-tRNA(Asn)/glutamyl-tRNA(Gln) amidotransferase subunit C
MKITREDAEAVALLSRLEIGENDIEKFTVQLNSILEYFALLDKLDTAGVEPTAHVLPLKNVMRPDAARSSLPRDEALANAPDNEDGYFKVPRILEG